MSASHGRGKSFIPLTAKRLFFALKSQLQPLKKHLFTLKKIKTFSILFVTYYIFIATKPKIWGDGYWRYCLMKAIMNGMAFNLTQACKKTSWPLLQPILAIPLALLDKISHIGLVAYFNLIVIGLFFLTSYQKNLFRLNNEQETDKSTTILMLIFLLSTSMLLPHARYFYGEVLSSLLVVLAIMYSRINHKTTILLLFFACLALPQLLPASIFFIIILNKNKINNAKQTIIFVKNIIAPFTLLVIAVFLLERYIKYGTPFHIDHFKHHGKKTILPYSEISGFGYPIILGIINILTSTGKGLIFYCPAYFLLLSENFRTYVKNIYSKIILYGLIIFTIFFIFLYAKWFDWTGGLFYGPRFFFITSITSSIILVLYIKYSLKKTNPTRRILLCFFLINWCWWVFTAGYVHQEMWLHSTICGQRSNYMLEPVCWHTPEFSELFRPFVIGNPLHKIWHSAFDLHSGSYGMKSRVILFLWFLVNITFLKMVFIKKIHPLNSNKIFIFLKNYRMKNQ